MSTTTHLVCAPEELPANGVVLHWHAVTGEEVAADAPLLTLRLPDGDHTIATPLAGVLSEYCVQIGEVLQAGELVAMIEAEELEFGFLLPAEEVEENLALPACRQVFPPMPVTTTPTDDALQLCAALGLAADEVPSAGANLQLADVYKHVRQQLRLLATLRQMLA